MTVTQVFQVSGMHCPSCSLLIDETLEELTGVESSQTSYKKGTVTVRLDPATVTPQEVVAAIATAGYTARMPA